MPNPLLAGSSKKTSRNRSKLPLKPRPKLKLVNDLRALGFERIIGVDEVGRGALAGPVVVAAVELSYTINGITDSKLLSKIQRQILAAQIHRFATQISFGSASNQEIDELGLGAALRLAYDRALAGVEADLILTDAYTLPGVRHCRAIQGDQLFYPTAAASIVAKVYRDQLMSVYHQFHPEFNWAQNVGYGTASHLSILSDIGPSPLHRRSFLKPTFTP